MLEALRLASGVLSGAMPDGNLRHKVYLPPPSTATPFVVVASLPEPAGGDTETDDYQAWDFAATMQQHHDLAPVSTADPKTGKDVIRVPQQVHQMIGAAPFLPHIFAAAPRALKMKV